MRDRRRQLRITDRRAYRRECGAPHSRRSFDGLCAAVIETLQANPLDGHLFLFRGKRSDRIKALIWDRNGLAIWYKRLEKGRYRWPTRDAVSIEITEQELSLLLDGVDFTRIRRLPAVHAHAAL
jgi:transposase